MPHLHELIDFTAEVFIVHKNKVLLRKHDKLGIWLSVGGHIELDEDPNQAAIREVKEEVGLDVILDDTLRPALPATTTYHELIPPYFLNIHNITPTHQHIVFVYFAKAATNKLTETIKEEHSNEMAWFTKKEIEAHPDLLLNVKYYALAALERLSD